jgi:hypothetical protein
VAAARPARRASSDRRPGDGAVPRPRRAHRALLHLHRLLRIDVAPVQIAPPWGVTVLDLRGRLPLPAKISIEVLAPIDQREELGGAGGDPDAGNELIAGRMQDALRELDEARALPLIG